MSQLLYRCRRGMLELDWLLQRFVTTHPELPADQLATLELLLSLEDDELWRYLIADEVPADHQLAELCACIRQG